MGCTKSVPAPLEAATPTKPSDQALSSTAAAAPAKPAAAAAAAGGISEEAAKKIQKIFRASSYKTEAKKQRSWQIFSELDTLDEAETLMLARFMNVLMDRDFSEYEASSPFDATNSVLSDLSGGSHGTPQETANGVLHVDSIKISVKSELLADDADITDYTIPKGTLQPETVMRIAEVYKQGGKLNQKSLYQILKAMYKLVLLVPNVTEITVDKSEKMTIVGDIHGQIEDLFYILDNSGWPGPTNKYIFNGDFVDRGKKGVEVVTLLFALYVAYPGCVFLNRGNHEDKAICAVYGFQKECGIKYGNTTYIMFCEIFTYLPLCAIVNDAVFVVHGGLFHQRCTTIADLNQVQRTDYKAEKADPDAERNKKDPTGFYLRTLQQCALWSDPHSQDIVIPNRRGAGVMFGVSMTLAFLELNNLKLVVRSHECVEEGVIWPFKGTQAEKKLCTLFSASDYSASGNMAAYMIFYNHAVADAETIEGTTMCFTSHAFTTSTNNSYSDLAQQESEHLLHDLILKRWNALKSSFSAADEDNTGFITKAKWAEIMLHTTKVSILWLPMISIIVPPEALKGNELDYTSFLMKYQIGSDESEANLHDLYAQRKKLESIFRFFDTDGGGTISREEFRVGVESINKTLPVDKQLTDADVILDLMDFDKSDSIDMNEFFEVRLNSTVMVVVLK
jgi:serine/threonine-protein phosphatase with EF-hand domain